jgi:hypothetical protein
VQAETEDTKAALERQAAKQLKIVKENLIKELLK